MRLCLTLRIVHVINTQHPPLPKRPQTADRIPAYQPTYHKRHVSLSYCLMAEKPREFGHVLITTNQTINTNPCSRWLNGFGGGRGQGSQSFPLVAVRVAADHTGSKGCRPFHPGSCQLANKPRELARARAPGYHYE